MGQSIQHDSWGDRAMTEANANLSGMNTNLTLYGIPYVDQWELVDEFMMALDCSLFYYYKHHQWTGPDNNLQNMLGLAVSRQEFERNLLKASESVVGINLEYDEIADVECRIDYILSRINASKEIINKECSQNLQVIDLMKKFKLDKFSILIFMLSLVVTLDRKYEKIFAYLQDDISLKLPIAETAIKLFAAPGTLLVSYFNYFNNKETITKFLLDKDNSYSSILNIDLRIHKRILSYIIQPDKFEQLPVYMNVIKNSSFKGKFINDIYSKRIKEVIDTYDEDKREIYRGTVLLFIKGSSGSGKSYRVLKAFSEKRKNVIMVDLKAFLEEEGGVLEKLSSIIREKVISQGVLVFKNFETFIENENKNQLKLLITNLENNAEFTGNLILFLSTQSFSFSDVCSMSIIEINIDKLTEEKRLEFWNMYASDMQYGDDVDFKELSSKFEFTPDQIVKSIRHSETLKLLYKLEYVSSELLHRCCYSQAITKLGDLANKINPSHTWNDLILPKEQIELLKDACSHIKFKHKVYNEWGLKDKVSYGKGLTMLFSGPPGTGKTMAAQIVAKHLHMEIYKIRLSQVVSKYIGETEKNLQKIFSEAQEANCILFFDETDALFGKRSEVKDSHDRHANIETAFLLQQMEEYEGVILMATNLLQNIDEAFMRRINFVINFPFPAADVRKEIWENFLNTGMPVEENLDLDFLSKQFEVSGGSIKNIVVHAAFLAAAEGVKTDMRLLLKSALYEMRKNNQIVLKEDLKQYTDLVFR